MGNKVRDLSTGKWIDSSVFRQQALNFKQSGSFCPAPEGSPDWLAYWTEQLRRCKEGYEVDGHKITGHHYFYLNFTQIEIVKESKDGSAVATKVHECPDFWDGDYDYFWSLEIAKNGLFTDASLVPSTQEERIAYRTEQFILRNIQRNAEDEGIRNYKDTLEYKEAKHRRDLISIEVLRRLGLRVKPHLDYVDGGYHMIVGKSRRKGYSYKDGAICANIYNTVRNCQVIIGAFDKKFLYPNGTMGMASNYLNFLNEHTGWAKSRDFVDKQEHRKASYKTTVDGKVVEKGYKSEIFALTFQDNPDAARGKDAIMVLLEEAGAFPNLKEAYNAIYPALTGGSYITGQIVIFGTGGDMNSGTAAYADMFYNPLVYRLMPFINIWDKDAENTVCGFFHPVIWNMEGFYDEQGNSDLEEAIRFEEARRNNIIANSSSSAEIQKHVQEYPYAPEEAFLTVSHNNFPVVELRNQLNKVKAEKLQTIKGTPVELAYVDGKVTAKPILDNSVDPIYDYKPKTANLTGAPIIYEYPEKDTPRGLYKIGYDPYRQDLSKGVSLGAIYVYKTVKIGAYTKNIIVAEYVGRPPEANDVSRIALMFAELYDTEVMHENEVTHVKDFFRRSKQLNRLAAQPDAVISNTIKNSTVARVYGIHMVDKLKDAGESYIKDWLLEVRDYDSEGNPITNLETIYSIGLLEELIQYNRKGNFDRVMAFMMCMFQVQEESLGKEYNNDKLNENVTQFVDFFNKINNR